MTFKNQSSSKMTTFSRSLFLWTFAITGCLPKSTPKAVPSLTKAPLVATPTIQNTGALTADELKKAQDAYMGDKAQQFEDLANRAKSAASSYLDKNRSGNANGQSDFNAMVDKFASADSASLAAAMASPGLSQAKNEVTKNFPSKTQPGSATDKKTNAQNSTGQKDTEKAFNKGALYGAGVALLVVGTLGLVTSLYCWNGWAELQEKYTGGSDLKGKVSALGTELKTQALEPHNKVQGVTALLGMASIIIGSVLVDQGLKLGETTSEFEKNREQLLKTLDGIGTEAEALQNDLKTRGLYSMEGFELSGNCGGGESKSTLDKKGESKSTLDKKETLPLGGQQRPLNKKGPERMVESIVDTEQPSPLLPPRPPQEIQRKPIDTTSSENRVPLQE